MGALRALGQGCTRSHFGEGRRLSREAPIPSVQGKGSREAQKQEPRPHSHQRQQWEDEEPPPEAQNAAGSCAGPKR